MLFIVAIVLFFILFLTKIDPTSSFGRLTRSEKKVAPLTKSEIAEMKRKATAYTWVFIVFFAFLFFFFYYTYSNPSSLGIPVIKMADMAFMVFLIKVAAASSVAAFLWAIYLYFASKNYLGSLILFRFTLISLFMPLLVSRLSYSQLEFWTFMVVIIVLLKARISWVHGSHKDKSEKTAQENTHMKQVLTIYALIFAIICLTLGVHIYIDSTIPNLSDPTDAPMCTK